MELIQVGVPIIGKLCEQYGAFGYKPLTTELATQHEMQHKEQLKEIKALSDKLQNHPILKQRAEYHLAREAFEQAQLRFRNCFHDPCDPDHRVTTSENNEVIHLIDLAHQALTAAQTLRITIDEEHPEFIEQLEKFTAQKNRTLKKLHEIQRVSSDRTKKLQKQQNAIFEKSDTKHITPEQEATLDTEWDRLDKEIRKVRQVQENLEPIYGAFTYLLRKIDSTLEAGCLPEQLPSLQQHLALAKLAMEEMAAGNKNMEEWPLADIIAIVDYYQEREITLLYPHTSKIVTPEFLTKKPASTGFFAIKERAASSLPAAVTFSVALPVSTITGR